jgi:hypothetical protein
MTDSCDDIDNNLSRRAQELFSRTWDFGDGDENSL